MTTATFKFIDPSTYTGKPWSKVDGPGMSFKLTHHEMPVTNIRGHESEYTTDNCGFAIYHSPAKEKSFTDDAAVRNGYYAEVESLLRKRIPGIKKVVIFDHTIRRHVKDSPRQPVQQVHVDQTPKAAQVRVRRHLPADEAEELLKGRYQIINVWRPIENPAFDFPLAVIDWRSTEPTDFFPVDLMYPIRRKPQTNGPANGLITEHTNGHHVDDDDDRGKEVLPTQAALFSTAGYEVKGETFRVAPNPNHKFCYVKDHTPDEVTLLKCYDSHGEGEPNGIKGIAVRTPHAAFEDPATPKDAPLRQSIELRCLVFYDE